MISICIFGSQARGTADLLSDRDLLLIGNESGVADEALFWKAQGWNITTFPPRAFQRLCDVQALFVQHVKLEGKIVQDDHGFLASTLDHYTPKTNYWEEIEDVCQQVSLLPSPRGNYWWDLCLADIMCVLVRNLAVFYLASSQKYIFDFTLLIRGLSDALTLEKDHQEALLTLRKLKHAYRLRSRVPDCPDTVFRAHAAVTSLISQVPRSAVSSIATGMTSDSYFRLRLAELDLVRQHDPRDLDALPTESELYARWLAIRRSGGYPKPRPWPDFPWRLPSPNPPKRPSH